MATSDLTAQAGPLARMSRRWWRFGWVMFALLVVWTIGGAIVEARVGPVRGPATGLTNALLLGGLPRYVLSALIALTAHAVTQAFVASLLGDNVPRTWGYRSLNPVSSFEIPGSLLFLFTGLGWAQPVPVNGPNLRARRLGFLAVAASGPLANLLIAAVALGIDQHVAHLALLEPLAHANLALALFSLLPVPPLDGFNIIFALLPSRIANNRVYQYIWPWGWGVSIALVLGAYLAPAVVPFRVWMDHGTRIVASWLSYG